jgi:hypothetical protein
MTGQLLATQDGGQDDPGHASKHVHYCPINSSSEVMLGPVLFSLTELATLFKFILK